MKIYTITLSPAYDVHAWADTLALDRENLVHLRSREAGGKGVNISRALQSVGIPNTAVVVLGLDNSTEFRESLGSLDCRFIEVPGRIRENLTIHVTGGQETRISYPGFSVDEKLLERVEAQINTDGDTVVTFTGRVPGGISIETVKEFLFRLKKRGVKVVLDSKSFGFRDICQIGPWLIKPNQEEIGEFFHCAVGTVSQAIEKCGVFHDCGVENVMLSMGEQGAALICREGTYAVPAPPIEAVSTVGAGDSTLAGFIAAYAAGQAAEQCLCSAVAFGSAACLTEGSQPPEREDIFRLLAMIHL